MPRPCRVYIIESNGGSETFGWYPVYMRNTMEQAELALKPLVKRWPDAYRIVEYVPAKAELQELNKLLPQFSAELIQQLTIACEWLETQAHKYCKCENNGDYCEFHNMLADAKEALK